MEQHMPKVMECNASNCAYNSDQACHALAITIGEPDGEPSCDTFFTSQKSGGVDNATAGVGACKIDECKFNEGFECTASAIQVGMQAGEPDCMTYENR